MTVYNGNGFLASIQYNTNETAQSTGISCFLHTIPRMLKTSSREAVNTRFKVLGETRPGIEPESTALVADALTTLFTDYF